MFNFILSVSLSSSVSFNDSLSNKLYDDYNVSQQDGHHNHQGCNPSASSILSSSSPSIYDPKSHNTKNVSEATRRVFSRNITYSILNSTHVIVYNIPSPNGSIEPGTRLLNFAWYTNVPSSSLDDIMTDTSGKRHRISISPKHFQPCVWTRQRSIARDSLPEPYLEIMDQIISPFVHLITDF
ncbi:hypothetical protein N8T08_005601 [Aspergillus melleus]|uniref:Uncharacterized protein n=1 Tax=Aspergillus melleus TaxID=138277 RepID=A0ACC3B1G4_9EURO|nr:hypothetical protein N8T08_005601 [Aspergillus melleus]